MDYAEDEGFYEERESTLHHEELMNGEDQLPNEESININDSGDDFIVLQEENNTIFQLEDSWIVTTQVDLFCYIHEQGRT